MNTTRSPHTKLWHINCLGAGVFDRRHLHHARSHPSPCSAPLAAMGQGAHRSPERHKEKPKRAALEQCRSGHQSVKEMRAQKPCDGAGLEKARRRQKSTSFSPLFCRQSASSLDPCGRVLVAARHCGLLGSRVQREFPVDMDVEWCDERVTATSVQGGWVGPRARFQNRMRSVLLCFSVPVGSSSVSA